jgi:archaellum biogenesis ATPase FlaH
VQINSRFIGRRQQIEWIGEHASRSEHVSLVGERRMGKSSLLWQLYLERRTLMPGCLVAYVDMQGYACHTQRGFLTVALRALLADLDDPAIFGCVLAEQSIGDLNEEEAVDLTGFKNALRALADCEAQPLRAVLLIDEFEAMLQYRDEFSDTFFGALRNLTSHGRMAFVVASHRSLTELPIAQTKSSFPNIFAQCPLGCFTPKEAHELVSQPSDRPLDGHEMSLALRLGRNYPHLLQLACSEIYRAKSQTPPDLARVEREFPRLVANTRPPREEPSEPSGPKPWPTEGSAKPLNWLGPVAAVGRFARLIGGAWNDIQNTVIGVSVIVAIVLLLLGFKDTILRLIASILSR